MKNKLLITVLIIALVLITPCYASSIDNAKEMIDNYYLYSKEKNVEKYSSLFDQQYVTELYGKDYKLLFKEIFTYYEVTEYNLNFQYYTESQDSLSLFYNLQAKTLIEGEKVNMDNDLVALFSKTNGELKLKYIILQETFVEQMNREVIYEAAIKSFVEENSDLKEEAETKNIDLINYKKIFEDKINNDQGTKNKVKLFLLIIVILIILGIVAVKYKENIKNKKVREYIHKTEKVTKNTGRYIKQKYVKTKPIVKSETKKLTKKIVKLTKNINQKITATKK
ncbi:MAG: hypothetical protein ACP5N2_03310 [Candidatus Nanoarchaeia archaeon]